MSATNITSTVDAASPDTDQSHSFAFGSSKISHRHHERLAIVYVRQSDPQQVLQHRESKELQYKLVDRAVALGWLRERVLVIDEDQGQSAQSAAARQGFQRLLAEVALDHVGLVLGFQMSRLARSCKDWHQLLELCARFGTLLTDMDGMYDPADYNDRLLLGLKGTMSEAELHMMRQRMQQGRSNKARRGEFFNHVPIGYVRGESGQAMMDPDEEVQAVVQLAFDKFDEIHFLFCHYFRDDFDPEEWRRRALARGHWWESAHWTFYGLRLMGRGERENAIKAFAKAIEYRESWICPLAAALRVRLTNNPNWPQTPVLKSAL